MRGFSVPRTQSTMSSVVAPGREDCATPAAFSVGDVLVGDDAAAEDGDVAAARARAARRMTAGKSVMCAPERIERPIGVDVLLDRGLGDHLGRLVQAGVDHLEAGVAERARDDLGAAVVAVEPGLGDQDAERPARS